MNDPKDDYCDHKWDSFLTVRLCLSCGEVRALPDDDSNARVLWPGRETTDDPLQLPKADKALIADVAHRVGAKNAAKVTGIRMGILRAWVSVYCRKPREPGGVTKLGRPRKPREEHVAKEVPVPMRPPLAVIMTTFAPGNCLICDGGHFDSHYKPHYIQTPGGKLWLCGACAEGVVKLFEALGILCQVIEGKDQ